MGFRIDVKGLKEAQDMINDLGRGLDPNVFANWADTITRTAKLICNDPECKRIKLKHTQRLGIEFEFADKEAIDCVISAIRQHMNSIPIVLAEVYKQTIIDLENRKKEFKST